MGKETKLESGGVNGMWWVNFLVFSFLLVGGLSLEGRQVGIHTYKFLVSSWLYKEPKYSTFFLDKLASRVVLGVLGGWEFWTGDRGLGKEKRLACVDCRYVQDV